MPTKEIKDLKQSSLSIFLPLLNGPYALPVIMGGILWFLSGMTDDQTNRLKEVLPLLNSTPGIALAIVIVVSYLGNIFVSPIREMTKALSNINHAIEDMRGEIHNKIERFDKKIEMAAKQHRDIQEEIEKLAKFYPGH